MYKYVLIFHVENEQGLDNYLDNLHLKMSTNKIFLYL